MSPLALTPNYLADLSMFSDLLEVEERNCLATYHDAYLRKNTQATDIKSVLTTLARTGCLGRLEFG